MHSIPLPGQERDAAPVVIAAGGSDPGWAGALESEAPVRFLDADAAEGLMAAHLGRPPAVFIDGGVEAPLSLARRLHRLAPEAQLVIVTGREEQGQLQRSLLYTPGIGEVWMTAPEEVNGELLREASTVAEMRRGSARRAVRMAGQTPGFGAGIGRRPFLADQYLATLLELLPHPVLALDQRDGVLFANPASAALLGLERGQEVTGAELRSRMAPVDPGALETLLKNGREGVTRRELRLRADGSERVFDASAAPVSGERPTLAVVLHDVTEAVRSRERLSQQAEELQQQNEELQALAEEMELQAEEMEAQTGRLEDALKHRSRFYANMSHELRTPINAIVGYTDLLLGDIYGPLPEVQRNALDRTRRAAGNLLELVSDVLDLAKVEAGRIDVVAEQVDLVELTRDLHATMQPLAREHGAEFVIEVEEECDHFPTDPRRLRQILVNLLSNAIRYGGGARVELRLERKGSKLIASVRDQGPGIPAEDLERIFEEFVQLEERAPGGTGLGLAIARALTAALGGELVAQSEVGRGSVFEVRLSPLPLTEVQG